MRKEHKSKTGGLTAKGRAHFKRTMGKGTYGSKKGRPPKKGGLTAGQKKLPATLKNKIMKAKKKK